MTTTTYPPEDLRFIQIWFACGLASIVLMTIGAWVSYRLGYRTRREAIGLSARSLYPALLGPIGLFGMIVISIFNLVDSIDRSPSDSSRNPSREPLDDLSDAPAACAKAANEADDRLKVALVKITRLEAALQ